MNGALRSRIDAAVRSGLRLARVETTVRSTLSGGLGLRSRADNHLIHDIWTKAYAGSSLK
jgi:hypothetical protein